MCCCFSFAINSWCCHAVFPLCYCISPPSPAVMLCLNSIVVYGMWKFHCFDCHCCSMAKWAPARHQNSWDCLREKMKYFNHGIGYTSWKFRYKNSIWFRESWGENTLEIFYIFLCYWIVLQITETNSWWHARGGREGRWAHFTELSLLLCMPLPPDLCV